jgi:1,4-dihydroxy-2-naphthoyl-CoA hydrolase
MLEQLSRGMEGRLPALLGLQLLQVENGRVEGRLDVRPDLLAPNEFLHAGTIITMADSCAGMGCLASLPEGAGGFTTVELKTNFFATARDGGLRCKAWMAHGGSRTQVWDAEVSREDDGRVIALFRCTQFLLPREDPRTERQQRARHIAADGDDQEEPNAG